MAGIPDEIIDRIRADANIVDVVGDYVRLRRTGKNWTGLCPFHDDKKPSFHVEPVKGIFKCFACGEGGNVFTFLMKKNGWSFPETVRSLADELGIEIPDDSRESEDYSERERLVSLMRDSARYYHELLKSEEGAGALAYFRGRGFAQETITRFGLGYAPDAWSRLAEEMTGRGYREEELEATGLAIPRREKQGVYDRFRNRALFPIFEASGRLVGFGARALVDNPDQPKYINSPESTLYHKSRVLYGLYQAKEAIRKKGYALFVEGYADVISLHEAGIATAIATCGTAIAPEHARLIKRFTDRALLVFDSDAAGERATERGIETLISGGLTVAVVRLPDGEDPDTFVRKEGADEFERRLGEAVPFVEYLADLYRSRGDFDDPERAASAIRALVAVIALVPDELRRRLHVNRLASEYRIDETTLHRELATALKRDSRRRGRPPIRNQGRPEEPPAPTDASGVTTSGPPPDAPMGDEIVSAVEASRPSSKTDSLSAVPEDPSAFPPAELRLVEVLATGDTGLLRETFERIDEEEFTHPLLRRFVELILAHYLNHESFALDELNVESLDEPMQRFVAGLVVESETISDYWRSNDPEYKEPNQWKIARDCLVRMQIDRLRRDEERLLDELRTDDPSSSDEGERVERVLEEITQIGRKVQELQLLLSGE